MRREELEVNGISGQLYSYQTSSDPHEKYSLWINNLVVEPSF
jgi:hypothetical protein